MPTERKITISDTDFIVVWETSESVGELIELLQPNACDLDKVNSFRLERRKKEYLTSRYIIKEAIEAYPQISYKQTGKPTLLNSGYNISITHTKNFVAVAFSENHHPGIDIEFPSDRIMKVSTRFIHPSEMLFIPKDDQLAYFTLIWCTKEAIFKIIDKEGVTFNEDLVCKPFPLSNKGRIEARYSNQNTNIDCTFEYIITPAYNLVYSIP